MATFSGWLLLVWTAWLCWMGAGWVQDLLGDEGDGNG